MGGSVRTWARLLNIHGKALRARGCARGHGLVHATCPWQGLRPRWPRGEERLQLGDTDDVHVVAW